MSFVLLLPVFLSSLLIAAHFLRAGLPLVAFVCLMVPFVLLFPRRWAARIVQVFLILSTLEWVRTLLVIAEVRVQMGQQWVRMAVIILAVACITAGSVYVFFAKPLKKRYKL